MKKWQEHMTYAGKEGFKEGSLREIAPIRFGEWLERIIVFPLYMILNAAPLAVPPLLFLTVGWRGCVYFVLTLVSVHTLLVVLNPMGSPRSGQYILTERHIEKYNSIKWVWPKSLQPDALPSKKIFCVIPHGLAPLGTVAYPGWSKLFGERLNHPTAAPAVLKLPIISYFLKKIGYVTAESASIKKTLKDKDENVLVILDGINGMFQHSKAQEIGYVKQRKGIVKIALATGTPIVPIFGFGHSELWRIIVDPWGILEKVSLALGVSVTPFCGLPFGLLPFGPPYRTPVVLAFGEPVMVPQVDTPSQEMIDEYHKQMMDNFTGAFETHKKAYGWEKKSLKLV